MEETTFLGTARYLHHTFKKSKMLAYCTYDTLCSLLVVIFHNGTQYEYPGIPKDIYEELILAESAGTYFNTVIRKNKCTRIK